MSGTRAFYRLIFALSAVLPCLGALGASPQARVKLPIEVTGENGTEVSVAVFTPALSERPVRSLWMRIHNLEYADMVSVRVNEGQWISLTNDSARVAEPARSYGGIGGGMTTLALTVPLPAAVVDGSNRIHFRFNSTNGVVSGFRVLAFNFLDHAGRAVLPEDTFIEEDPNGWEPPLRDAANLAAGQRLWRDAPLAANGLPKAPPIRAHCSDCHTQDGRDLKYFNFSNASIVARSRFHGLSELQGRQIASYIRSLPFPNPGRPWNPPYQPGPGLDSQPAANWAAGAGLKWVLENDADTLPFLFGKDRAGALAINSAAFAPDGDLDQREVPIALPLPDWNHWLPRVHPIDAFGSRFEKSAFAQLYQDSEYAEGAAAAEDRVFFDRWSKSRSQFLTPHLTAESKKWSPELAEDFYSAELWQLVKTWEMTEEHSLEALDSRVWPNTVAAFTAPASVNIPDSANGMGGSALTNEYFNNAWYELQVIVNAGNHKHHGKTPVDWVYLIGRIQDLQRLSGRPEPGRLLATMIKALQSSDPSLGPENMEEGWRPEQDVDPRIMVASEWAPMFSPLGSDVKQAITEALLSAWLDKTLRYAPASYFHLGLLPSSYSRPTNLQGVSGGRVWEAAPEFRAAGVKGPLIDRLEKWGRKYNDLAGLFHY